MDRKEDYLQKIDDIPAVSFNREQKAIAKKIIASADEADLHAVFGLITQRVKTGFVFDEAPEVNHNAVALAVETPELNIGDMNIKELEDNTEHTLIIGENYDALKNLCATYIDKNGRGMIDVIYIDPPYNTEATKNDGNDYKDEVAATKFIYRDKFTRDGWLNMMNERLKLAKRLLSDRGVIFISIDDSEQAYLKVLCDEIFGEENFVGTIICQTATDNNPTQISTEHEYILCYAKRIGLQEAWIIESVKAKQIQDKYESLKQKNSNIAYIQNELRKWIKANENKLQGVKHYNNVDEKGVYSNSSNSSNTKPGGYTFDIIHPKTGKPCVKPAFGWRWTEETFWNYDKKGDIEWGLNEMTQPHVKKRIDTVFEQLKSIYYEDGRAATKQLESIFCAKKVFPNPKSTVLLKLLINFSIQNKNAIILDFFAGSGTTGQAVMELNAEDGGRRKFILVTNNENGIGERITRERLYRVINGRGSKGEEIAWKYSDKQPSLAGNSVRVFGIESHELTLQNLDKAEELKTKAKTEFKKLNPACELSDDFDLYYELSALNPVKK